MDFDIPEELLLLKRTVREFVEGRLVPIEKQVDKKLGSKKARRYNELRTAFQERGDEEALQAARALLEDTQNLSLVQFEIDVVECSASG